MDSKCCHLVVILHLYSLIDLHNFLDKKLNKETDKYEGVFAWGSNGGQEGIVLAQSAYRRADTEKGSVFLVLENGVRYEGAPGDSVYRVINFERYTLRDRKMASAPVRYPLHGWKTTRLWRSMGPYEQKEIAWRISKVIVLPILMIFALSLGRVEPRSNRYVSMFSALLIYFTYTNGFGFKFFNLSRTRTYSWRCSFIYGPS